MLWTSSESRTSFGECLFSESKLSIPLALRRSHASRGLRKHLESRRGPTRALLLVLAAVRLRAQCRGRGCGTVPVEDLLSSHEYRSPVGANVRERLVEVGEPMGSGHDVRVHYERHHAGGVLGILCELVKLVRGALQDLRPAAVTLRRAAQVCRGSRCSDRRRPHSSSDVGDKPEISGLKCRLLLGPLIRFKFLTVQATI